MDLHCPLCYGRYWTGWGGLTTNTERILIVSQRLLLREGLKLIIEEHIGLGNHGH